MGIRWKKFDWSDREALEILVKRHKTRSDILRTMNLVPSSNMRTLNKYIARYNMDTSHFDPILDRPRRANGSTKLPIEERLRLYSYDESPSQYALRNRIIKEKVLKYECRECGNKGEWNGLPLALHLEHINGNHLDYRKENLEFLCPNCHSLTPTFAGKKNRI